MVTLENTEEYLVDVERGIEELKKCCDARQNERFLSNHVWMTDFLERKLVSKLTLLKDALKLLKTQNATEFKSETQFDAMKMLCDELAKIFDELAQAYRMRLGYSDVSLKIKHNLPKMQEKIKSFRNRFTIVKNQINQGIKKPFDDDDW